MTRYVQLPPEEALVPLYWNETGNQASGTREGAPITLLRCIGEDAEAEFSESKKLGSAWSSMGSSVEPVKFMHIHAESDDSEEEASDEEEIEGETDAARALRRQREQRRRREKRSARRSGKLVLRNVMKFTNFKGFKRPVQERLVDF